MNSFIHDHKARIINQILLCASQEEVAKCIDEEFTGLRIKHCSQELTIELVNEIINSINQFNPITKEAQQWANIKFAAIILRRLENKTSKEAV